ncbi:hypothetical protein [Flavobacterium sp.]|uniref:hypothetical protein n=1 Tax=Flavobacterium sp. TaxID=239 RepID=UPI00334122A8
MKKKLFKIFSSFALVASIIFFSCEKNEVNIDEHSHVDKNKISFKEFLNKTQIKKFKFEISTNSSTNQSLVNRQSSDFISFVVDTTLVKQRIQISGNYTFTLPVIPVPYQNTESLFYNIVFYKANNAWQWSVLEYQKEGNNEFNVTEIVNDFNHNGLVNMRLQGVWGTITTFNCVGCKGACDLCPLCVSTTTTYDLATLDDPTSKFEIIEGTGNNNNGATSVNVGMALADNFANTQLTPEQKLIYDLNPSIREYLSNNKIVVSNPNYNPLLGGDPTIAVIDQDAEQFVKELIDSEINGNLLSFFPTFKYPAGSNYATQYPKLTEYLKNKIPELKNNQFIINKLVQYSELSSQQVINDLKWGQGPTIQIAQLDSRGVNCYGIFSSATPNVLTIDIDFVNLLENSTPGPEGDSLAFLLGVTILHEYVHLGDFVDGIDQPGEEGLLFEQATYGETIWLNNAGDVLIKWQ